MAEVSGENPSGHIVWCYDVVDDAQRTSTYGYPVAISDKGRVILGWMATR